MTCSDDVAGLTPKLRATNVLCKIVDYVAQERPVSNGQVISHDKTLTSYYLCPPCLCYSSFGLVSNSDISGEAFFVIVPHFTGNIIEMILISKWLNQCIYILDEESQEYGDIQTMIMKIMSVITTRIHRIRQFQLEVMILKM